MHTIRSLPLKWETENIRRQLERGKAVIQENTGPLEPWNKYTVVPIPKTKAPGIPTALSEGAKSNWDAKILPWLKEHKTGLQVGAGAASLGLIAHMIAKNRKRKQEEERNKRKQ